MKNRYVYIGLFVIILTIIGLVWWFVANSRTKTIADFNPRFNNKIAEIYKGEQFYLYLKTPEKYNIGESSTINAAEIIKSGDKTTGAKNFSNIIGYVGDGYIGIELTTDSISPSCLVLFDDKTMVDFDFMSSQKGKIECNDKDKSKIIEFYSK